MADKKEKNEENGSAGSSKKKLFIIIGAVLLVLLLAGGATGYFLFIKKQPEETALDPNQPPPVPELEQVADIGPMVDIKEFIVNIISDDANHYVKASLTIELTNEPVQEEVTKRMPQLRDSILLLVGNKTHEELQDLQGKKQLKAELTSKLNGILKTGQVKSIYFTDFVVQ